MTNVGLRIKELSYQKGLKQIDLARLKGVTKQTISHDFKQERLSVESVKWYAKTLGVSIEDITKSNASQGTIVSTSEDVSWKEKYFDLLEESKALWQIVAQNGIKVDLKNFNLGGLSSAFGDAYFFIGSTQKATHP